MTNEDILAIAREYPVNWIDRLSNTEMFEFNDVELIIFARRIQQMERERTFAFLVDNGWISGHYAEECAAAIREQSDE